MVYEKNAKLKKEINGIEYDLILDGENIFLEDGTRLTDALSNMQHDVGDMEAGAQVNRIEHVKQNNVELSVTDKTVNVVVPTKISDLTNDNNYATETTVANAIADAKTYSDSNLSSHNIDDAAHHARFEEKFDAANAVGLVKNVSYNSANGNLTFTRYDNTTIMIDLPTEGIITDVYYDAETEDIVLNLISGQEVRIPAAGLIDQYTGESTSTIQITVSSDNKITANIIGGSVTKTLLSTALQNFVNDTESKTHTHDNKTVLDEITQPKINNWDGKLETTGDGSNVTASFSATATRINIATGEKLSVIFGKIAKWLSDLKAVAFSGSYNDLSDKPGNATASTSGFMSSTDKTKLDGVSSGSQANIIESVQRNGVALSITNKAVNVIVPTKNSELTNDSGYIALSDVPQPPVTGVKGSAESSYRTGEINLTPGNIGAESLIRDATTKTNLADADTLPLSDSAASNITKKITWANIKTLLGGIYVPLSRKVNGKTLSSDITITAQELDAMTMNVYDPQNKAQDVFAYADSIKFIDAVCSTGASTAAKVVTIPNYTLKVGDLFAIKYTSGNTASSHTININGAGAKAARLGGGAPTASSGSGGAYCASNNSLMYRYDGTYMQQFGSSDITDANDNTTSITNVYLYQSSSLIIANNTQGGTENQYAFIGMLSNETIDKITKTSANASGDGTTGANPGERQFTTNKISLIKNIVWVGNTTGAWVGGGVEETALFAQYSIGATNWKYSIGQYFNSTGTLVSNDVITGTAQMPVYVGGTKDGEYFIPTEYSVTLRDPTKVYKQIGRFYTEGNFRLEVQQPVYVYKNGNWQTWASSSDDLMFETSAVNIKPAGTANAGSSGKMADAAHIHPAQTTITGNAGTATTLANARTIQTNLASTSSASFNGSANVTPGVTGILPVANGGTGKSTALVKSDVGLSNVDNTSDSNKPISDTQQAALDTKLSLSGDTATGLISYNIANKTSKTQYPIDFIKGTSDGDACLYRGANGLTIVGAGEFAANYANLINNQETTPLISGEPTTFNSESVVIGADQNVYVVAGFQTAANRRVLCIASNGSIYPLNDSAFSLGAASNRLNNIYASSIIAESLSGELVGNAETATKLATPRSLKTKLDSTTTATFDGSAAQDAIPVTGTLPVKNGGTGAATLASGQALIGNGTGAIASRAITDIPILESDSLFTSGGAYSELNQKVSLMPSHITRNQTSGAYKCIARATITSTWKRLTAMFILQDVENGNEGILVTWMLRSSGTAGGGTLQRNHLYGLPTWGNGENNAVAKQRLSSRVVSQSGSGTVVELWYGPAPSPFELVANVLLEDVGGIDLQWHFGETTSWGDEPEAISSTPISHGIYKMDVVNGGTGMTTLPSGEALIGNGTDAITTRAITDTPASASTSLLTAGGAYTQLALKAPLASPALTGTPTAPTATTSSNSTQIATTAFVKAQGYLTTAPVQSVSGKTGTVTLAKGDVGLGNVDNTSDANKPISKATQTALNAKEDLIKNATTKTSLVDADTLPLSDSAASNATKKITWANIKNALSSVFVPTARKVNNKTLSADITLSANDVGAMTASIYDPQNKSEDIFAYVDNVKFIDAVCSTGASTAAKVVTIPDYTLKVGDLFSIKYTSGNTASSHSININGAGAKAVRLGGGAPSASSGSGAAYCASNNSLMYRYDGTYMQQFGSSDVTDADTTSISNYYEGVGSTYVIASNTQGGTQNQYPFIGVLADGTIDKVTATAASDTAAGSRTFTTNKLSLVQNILFISNTTGAWTGGAAEETAAFLALTTSSWKYAVGQYYNKAGTLTGNDVTTDLPQSPLYIGGVKDGNYFTPSEFSLTLRNTSLCYKRIGLFASTSSFRLLSEQPVYVYRNGNWAVWETASDDIVFETAASNIKAAGTASAGNSGKIADAAHVHPAQTTISGNAATATKLTTARTIAISGKATGTATNFDGSANITIPITELSQTASDYPTLNQNTTGSAATLTTARKIDGVNFNGSADISHYTTCSTSDRTVAKTASITGFALVTGAVVYVKFTNGSTIANPTLNITSTGAKSITSKGVNVGALEAGVVYQLIYDGTNYEIVSGGSTPVTWGQLAGK